MSDDIVIRSVIPKLGAPVPMRESASYALLVRREQSSRIEICFKIIYVNGGKKTKH